MASLKKLAGETVWYGLSNIVAKLLNQLLTPIITHLLNKPASMGDYGNFNTLMSCISFMNVIFTYGMETAFFRFSNKSAQKNQLFQTTFTSLLVTTFLLGALLVAFNVPLAHLLHIEEHPEYITWSVLIIAIDTLAAIPFAVLRQEGRPRKYAFTRLAGIIVNIIVTVFLIAWFPTHSQSWQGTWLGAWYARNNNLGFLLMANLAASAVTFLLLIKEWGSYRFKLDKELWKQLIAYAAPMVIVGLGGMINETLDRVMLPNLLPVSRQNAAIANAIYGGNYKIAIFITLFITAFRMSAEPFFFAQAADKKAPQTYARVMKWFVIILCFAFLFTALYIDLWKYWVDKAYWSGLGVVPILLAANVCLGIYYNLSVWYKITDRMRMGMYITLMGAALTLTINFAFIPRFGMFACAWATFTAYCSMMIVSYLLGQKYFPVPYNIKRLLAYLGTMLLLFGTQQLTMYLTPNIVVRLASATVLMLLFLRLVAGAEKQELKGMPVVGRWIK